MNKINKKKLTSILDSFFCELGVGYTMYFTDEEVDILVEHLIKHGVGVQDDRDRHQLTAFKEYFKDLYGQGLEIANWHQNGELEPFDNFYESAIEYSLRKEENK